MEEIFYDAADVAKLLGISKSKAYTVIRALNNELAANHLGIGSRSLRSGSLTQPFIAIDRLEWYNSNEIENTEREEGEDMSMPKGKEEYLIENEKVVAFGISHSTQEMEDALKNEVFDKIFDVREHLEIVKCLSDTGFDEAVIMERLFPLVDKEDWEIGEAYAQVYAETNLNSNIPWGISRDIKKPKSSLPGADIVGLYQQTDDTFFLFGEIKTSSHSEYPPSVMYGEHGLKKQLEDLCENKDITDKLVEYLAYRLKNSELWSLYSNAFSNYMHSDGKKVHILGVLVRDVEPMEDDLAARTKKLERFVVDGRSIELVGIYVPIGSIEKFPRIVSKERERRSASNVEKC